MPKPLVFIPTYNERDNVTPLCEEIQGLGLDLDILFVDDNSPDGTGRVLEELAARYPNVRVAHRKGKLGVGSAHYDGIRKAYDDGYRILITMDCDFTHPPRHIVDLLAEAETADVVVGSRYLAKRSLAGWNLVRKLLTWTGHALTRVLLGMKQDATGALRLYRLDRIPRQAFDLVSSKGYSFFFESLYILNFNGFRIREIPIALPPRTYGHSKMTFREIRHSVALLVSTWLTARFNQEKFRVGEVLPPEAIDPTLKDDQSWDEYWKDQKNLGGTVYATIAAVYRKMIIKRTLNHFAGRYFAAGAEVLHAGCGGGQVDVDLARRVRITGLDISVNALNLYQRTNGVGCRVLHGSIFKIPLGAGSMDGIYNLGVMEHFTEPDIDRILAEFRRVLRDNGRIIIFWPPEFGTSVVFLKGVTWTLENVFRRKNVRLHPDEITRVRSRGHVTRIFERNGFRVARYYFGPKDFFTHSIIVAEKAPEAREVAAGRLERPAGGRDVLAPIVPPRMVESSPPDLTR